MAGGERRNECKIAMEKSKTEPNDKNQNMFDVI